MAVVLVLTTAFLAVVCALIHFIGKTEILERQIHEFWQHVAAENPTLKKGNSMPKDASAELDELKAVYEAQKVKIADLQAAAANQTLPADIQAKIDALSAEEEADAAPGSTPSATPGA